MLRSDLALRLARKRKLSAAEAERIVDALFDAVVAALCRDERVEIRGFGSFAVRRYRGYRGRNPKTGAPIAVRAKRRKSSPGPVARGVTAG
jgi:integration host factor subunit beta